jgi:hypothetical protein
MTTRPIPVSRRGVGRNSLMAIKGMLLITAEAITAAGPESIVRVISVIFLSSHVTPSRTYVIAF